MLLDLVAHFTTFNLKAGSVTRPLIPKISPTQERRISFIWRIDVHLVFVEEHVYRCGNDIGFQ